MLTVLPMGSSSSHFSERQTCNLWRWKITGGQLGLQDVVMTMELVLATVIRKGEPWLAGEHGGSRGRMHRSLKAGRTIRGLSFSRTQDHSDLCLFPFTTACLIKLSLNFSSCCILEQGVWSIVSHRDVHVSFAGR